MIIEVRTMSKKYIKKNADLNRRQFIVKSAIGVCGLSAAYGTCKVAFSSNHPFNESFHDDRANKPDIPPYNPMALVFKQHQYAQVATLAALIIPTDDEPGATEAGVVDYIDQLAAGSEEKQRLYTNGLEWLDDYCREQYGQDFLDIGLIEQMEILSLAYDGRRATSFIQRVGRKLVDIWDGLTGTRINRTFFREIHKDVLEGFYSNPISWQQVGYFGPPNPVGYPDFSDKPSSTHYSTSVRMVDNVSCNTCHEIGEHPRGGLIDHSCIACHRPHAPWPYDEASFYLEDHVGVVFSNPDRKKRSFD
jgi:hypothetical protein